MAELRERDGFGSARLGIYRSNCCSNRRGDRARWSEIDLAGRLWTIPGSRMKAGREHRVPLSDAAMAAPAGLEHEGDRVFPISNMAMAMLLRRMDRGELTVHGFG